MSVNVLQNGKIVKLAGAVESDVIDQAIELATKQAVATAASYAETIVAQAGGFHTKVVDRLPLGSADPEDEEYISTSTLYFVPNILAVSQGSKNVYEEYMYVNDRWEQITKTQISKSDLDSDLQNELSAIYDAIGKTDNDELYSVSDRIKAEAVNAVFKTNDDGTIITVGDVLEKAYSFEPITDDEITEEFNKN